MSSHGIDVCLCGAVIAQCRCPGPHQRRVVRQKQWVSEQRAACTARRKLARAKVGSAFSCWPTVVAQDAKSSAKHTTTTGVMHPGTMLLDALRMWLRSRPTSTIMQAGTEPFVRSHYVNPRFVEWLMGFPLDWTVPTRPMNPSASTAFAHSAMRSFRSKLRGHSTT